MLKKRFVILDRDLCTKEKCGYQCTKICPVNRSGQECIKVDELTKFPVFDENVCIGCGICAHKCEKMSFKAIMLVNLPQELREDPIHRYGLNEFGLYRLPIPKKNIVTGLIGPNGVGKTTVLNILSGNLKPNTGLFDADVSWGSIIEKFKGTELQEYLENLSKGGVSIGYKPQNIDLIPKMWKGKVKDLLKRSGEPKKVDEIIKNLNMKDLLDKNIPELSGGELQLLAIAAVLLKDCDFYFFDEPSSYLDVKSRLLVAREIRNLVDRGIVMVVEHDLAILDYLSDQVHILYGKPAAFGVVSKPYGVRIGINTYLDGYIREENVKFRDKSIVFSKRAPVSEKNRLFLNFSGFEKRFENFSLKTESGSLYKGEVIGILGPNGIGKTTFIKMLAGQLKPEKGEKITGLKLSYKPQRLVLSEKEMKMAVREFLENEVGNKIQETEFKRKMNLFGVEKNLEKQVRSLSGGELQAVFILSSLGKPHDILLLDEPSAFLDVEQRLNMARLIRSHIEDNEISGFAVDHDLQVIDALSDRVMVFEGESGLKGFGRSPCSLHDGMNRFLKSLSITFRRDPHTGRPRANKPNSQKDTEQKKSGEFYYM
jgi:ATP-binding cassette subfamily E protein 1